MTYKDWTPTCLAELVEIKHGFAFKGEFFSENPPGDVLLTPGNFAIGGGFKDDKFKYYNGPVPEEFILKGGDLLVTMTDLSKQGDTLGYPAIVPRSGTHRYLHNQRLGKIEVVKESLVLKEYIYYLMQTDRYRNEVLASATGTTVKHTSPNRIKLFTFLLPSIPEQRAIARVLGSLDDKIEANRRMNETLEAIARAIFKSWFVDFDPVRARAEGRAPAGMDAETAALFPDSFEETEGRMVPKGWNVGSFDESIDLIGGGTPKTSNPEYWNGDVPWFSIVDVPKNSDVFVIKTEKMITERGIEESSTKLLPIGTTIITARGTVGKCALVGIPMAMNQSCYGIRGRDGRGNYFIYFALRNLVTELQQSTHGSVFDTITKETFGSVRSIVVPVELTNVFDNEISPLMGKIIENLRENNNLAAIRDALLPKLISGEIRMIGVKGSFGERTK